MFQLFSITGVNIAIMEFKKWMLILLLFTGSATSFAQDAKIIKWPELENILSPKSDTTYVINFWATWCVPCVKELPYFDNLIAEFPGKKLKVILVSLDFKRQFETNLKPYLIKNQVKSEVLLIDEPDYNSWIDKVDKSWGGAIPATIIINSASGKRKFYEKDFTKDELNETVKSFIQ